MADLMTLRRNIIASKAEKPVAKVYGVEWNYADPSTVLKRTGAAANFANPIPAESLDEVGYSPFDNVYPWSEMKRYNIINGEVTYSEDDAGYSETLYDTMVYIPEFYYYAYKDTTNQKWYWSISGTPLEGYEKHPGSGRYVGRFHTSGSSSGVYSKGNSVPLGNVTIGSFRNYSHNKGKNWYQIDIATWSAIQLLYLIEFSDWYSQSTLAYGQNTKTPQNTGGTSGAIYHTIKRSGADGNMYRWIENPYSQLLTCVDGIVVSTKNVYVSIDVSSYGDTIANKVNTNTLIPNSGYITGMGYVDVFKWLFIPTDAIEGSNSTYVTDYVFSDTSTRVLCVGGNWTASEGYGFFYFNALDTSSKAYASRGSRLIYIPST